MFVDCLRVLLPKLNCAFLGFVLRHCFPIEDLPVVTPYVNLPGLGRAFGDSASAMAGGVLMGG